MIQFKVRKKNDHVKNNIYTVYDIRNDGYDTHFLIYATTIGRWVWVKAEAYEPVEEDDNNGSA